jgi:hypothetical protein
VWSALRWTGPRMPPIPGAVFRSRGTLGLLGEWCESRAAIMLALIVNRWQYTELFLSKYAVQRR